MLYGSWGTNEEQNTRSRGTPAARADACSPPISDHSEEEEDNLHTVNDIKSEPALSISERTDRSTSPERERLTEEAVSSDREASPSPPTDPGAASAAAAEPPPPSAGDSRSPPLGGSSDRPTDGRSSALTPPDPAMFVSAEIKSEPGSPQGERRSPQPAGASPTAVQPPFIPMLPGLQSKSYCLKGAAEVLLGPWYSQRRLFPVQ